MIISRIKKCTGQLTRVVPCVTMQLHVTPDSHIGLTLHTVRCTNVRYFVTWCLGTRKKYESCLIYIVHLTIFCFHLCVCVCVYFYHLVCVFALENKRTISMFFSSFCWPFFLYWSQMKLEKFTLKTYSSLYISVIACRVVWWLIF